MKKVNKVLVLPIPVVLVLMALVGAVIMLAATYTLGRSHGIREAINVFVPPTPQLDQYGCEITPTKTQFGEIFLCNRQ